MLIFEKSSKGRAAHAQIPNVTDAAVADLPASLLRTTPPLLPEVSELQVVRHYTQLSRLNFSIDTNFYPLGSCTMKYNPRGAHRYASLPGFANRHPYAHASHSQGTLQALYELQEILKAVTGMTGISLSPMAGAQGEFAGVAMIQVYHHARGESGRVEMLIPDAAHGTNPASAAQCGFRVKEIPTKRNGDLDLDVLRAMVGPQTAGIMLTNPSTLGVFERQITEVAAIVHEAGGLLYYDGANLNAILGHVRPGDMGFDVMHMNLHKTFATPHGGGGPGAGPVAVNDRLKPYLPVPYIIKDGESYRCVNEQDVPMSIGRLSAFMGNAAILLRAYAYARLLGQEGLTRVGTFATLNANYLMKRLSDAGFTLAYPKRRASHEFVITLAAEAKATGVTALDLAKYLLDFGIHAPTMYFPLLVPECLLIEPTETEDKATLDHFVEVLIEARARMLRDAAYLKTAPHTLALSRLDEVKAARELDVVYDPLV